MPDNQELLNALIGQQQPMLFGAQANNPFAPAQQQQAQPPMAPTAGGWMAAHPSVKFSDGQPVEPAYNPRDYGFTTFGDAWGGANKHFQSPAYQAWLKAFNDPNRPLTQRDVTPGPDNTINA